MLFENLTPFTKIYKKFSSGENPHKTNQSILRFIFYHYILSIKIDTIYKKEAPVLNIIASHYAIMITFDNTIGRQYA